MTTLAHSDLRTILDLHRKWLSGEDGGSRAVLRGADLTGADLTRVVLRGADLTGADLRGADLTGADLTDAVLPDGVTWGEYLTDAVPALLTAGGRTLAEVATPEVWSCHSWDNCPMHAAFGVSSTREVPALYRAQAERFVQFYDANLIPMPVAAPAVETDPYFVLEFCEAAINDALAHEDGLDGRTGDNVLRMIAASKAARPTTPTTEPAP